MWLMVWQYPSEGEADWVPFDTQDAAQEQAAAEIINHIRSEWDLTSISVLTETKPINDAARNAEWGQVIDLFNNANTNADGVFMTWTVVELNPKDKAWITPLPFPQETFAALAPPTEEEEEIPPTLKSGQAPYQATDPGATCRGPSCGVYSEYAYADQPDGTFLCRSCQMMMSIFGGKP